MKSLCPSMQPTEPSATSRELNLSQAKVKNAQQSSGKQFHIWRYRADWVRQQLLSIHRSILLHTETQNNDITYSTSVYVL